MKFKTKIVNCVEIAHDYFELLLPNGDRVASGSFDHCSNVQKQWERVLSDGVQLELF